MITNTLITSDLHLSDLERDSYRWRIFSELARFVDDLLLDNIYILGDLTDAKDRHSAAFVSKVVANLVFLARRCPVTILKGNHDYTTGIPFFSFINEIQSLRFVHTIEEIKGCLWLPHTRDPERNWYDLDFSEYDGVFMHETAKGSLVSAGHRMLSGIERHIGIREDAFALSGDVHVPQKVGQIEYVGSPYHVHFGDHFAPRMLHFDASGKIKDVCTDVLFPRKIVETIIGIDDLRNVKFRLGDMVKFRVKMDRGDSFTSLRKDIIKYCEDKNIVIGGFEVLYDEIERMRIHNTSLVSGKNPSEVLEAYGDNVDLDSDIISFGKELISDADQS